MAVNLRHVLLGGTDLRQQKRLFTKRILRIQWVEHVNEGTLMHRIKKRPLKFLGNTRKECLEDLTLRGHIGSNQSIMKTSNYLRNEFV